ncbi:MAG: hypothetical protein WCC82_10580, partial [Nitrososphaeraceae archaeon]
MFTLSPIQNAIMTPDLLDTDIAISYLDGTYIFVTEFFDLLYSFLGFYLVFIKSMDIQHNFIWLGFEHSKQRIGLTDT